MRQVSLLNLDIIVVKMLAYVYATKKFTDFVISLDFDWLINCWFVFFHIELVLNKDKYINT